MAKTVYTCFCGKSNHVDDFRGRDWVFRHEFDKICTHCHHCLMIEKGEVEAKQAY